MHDVAFRGFCGESEAGQPVGDEVDPEYVQRQQGKRQSQERREHEDPDLA